MTRSTWLTGAAAALAIGFVAATAEAAPVAGAAADLKAAVGKTVAGEAVHWRHRRHWRGHYGIPYLGYYSYYPRYYYGYAPGFRLHYGSPRRFYRHHRHWRRWW